MGKRPEQTLLARLVRGLRIRPRRPRVGRLQRAREIGIELLRHHDATVLGGPFAGMRYVESSVCSMLAPKILGSYEAELHGVLGLLFALPYDRIINLGCGEGYYATGMALRLPQARVYAFDVDATARRLCEELAQRNGVADRVHVGDAADPQLIEELAGDNTLIVCDVEGAELSVLPPEPGPRVGRSDLLIELHDFVDPGISAAILSRFATTHSPSLIDTAPRDPRVYPALELYSPADRELAVNEFRPAAMRWALLSARDRPATRTRSSQP